MTDIVARLRRGTEYDYESGQPINADGVMDDAADTILALRKRVGELEGESNVLADILRDAYQVIKTIEGENSDEEERLWQLRYMIDMALAPYLKAKAVT